MKKYALGFGLFLCLFPFGHGLRGLPGGFDFLIHAIPVFVLWFTFCVAFVVYILDDFSCHGTLQSYPQRFTSNDAYREKLLHTVLAYQILFHIALLFSMPVFEALLAVTVLAYFLYRVNEV